MTTLAQINTVIARAKSVVSQIEKATNARLNAFYCSYGAQALIPGTECYRRKQDLQNLVGSFDRLERALAAPATGETTPVVLAHPDRALEVVEAYTQAVLAQAEILANWAQRTDLGNLMRSTWQELKTILREAAKKALELGTEAAKGALSEPGGWIALGVGALVLYVWLQGK